MRPIEDIHQANIADLIEREVAAGVPRRSATARVAERIEKDAAMIRQWLAEQGTSSYRGISSAMARHIESCYGLPHGWMDVDHAEVGLSKVAAGGSDGRQRRMPTASEAAYTEPEAGAFAVPHLSGYDNEPGPAIQSFPEAMVRELAHLHRAGKLAWVVNPTDSLGPLVPKGSIVFVDTSVKSVRGNGTYAVRLLDAPSIMKIQRLLGGGLRVMGHNRHEDAIDLYNEQLDSLKIGGEVLGYVDRVKLL